MKVKFGAIVVDGRGKIGGHVASKNRAGAYIRTKVTPVNPNTSYQSGVRNLLSGLASGWKALVASAQLAWNSAVVNYKKTDIFGDLKNPSGFNLYQRLNNNLSQIGLGPLPLPLLPVGTAVITTGVLAAVHAGAVTVTFTVDPIITACDIVADATPALSPGKSFVKSEFRRLGKDSTITSHVITLTTLYNAKYGAVGAAGQKLFVRLKMINKTTGEAGIPAVYSCIVT